MSKKTIFILLIGALLFSACKANDAEPTTAPDAETTQEVEEEPTEEAAGTDFVMEGDAMPCSTVYDYETTAEADYYQAIVDQLPPLSLEDDLIRGNPDAPITIFEYADFQCSACVSFAAYTELLLEYFPESIKVVFRHLPLASIHDKAFLSGMAGEAAAAQGKFWEMHDKLYQNQSVWFYFTDEEFIEWARTQAETLGLDGNQFEADMLDEEARAALEALGTARISMGMNYTPFVVINDRIFSDNLPDLFSLISISEYDAYEECPPWVIDQEHSYTAILKTDVGDIEIEFYQDAAPLAVNSFVFLAQEDWFDDIYFHSVTEDYVAIAGDPSGLGVMTPGYTFADEISGDLNFDGIGVVGMANSGTDKNGSQFFITLAPQPDLDGLYTVFGQVTEDSLAVLGEIALRDDATAVDFEDATIILDVEIIEE
jgi:cyclophilin family peptidyl-prolyl cis-trans isomerase/protein-disulfide isomerase